MVREMVPLHLHRFLQVVWRESGGYALGIGVNAVKDRIVRPEGEARVAHIVFASSLIDLMFSTKSGAASAWTIHGCIGRGGRVLKSS